MKKIYSLLRERIRPFVLKMSYICFKLTGRSKQMYFFIIGAQKCGTTSLFDFLNKHPDCLGAPFKETLLFSRSDYKEPTANDVWSVFPIKKLIKSGRKQLLFEATPDNVYFEEVPERLWRHNPDARLIFLVREPVSRAFSEYTMACRIVKQNISWLREDPDREYTEHLLNPEQYPFSWFIEEEFRKIRETGSYLPSAFHYPDFIRRGLYSDQLERYYRYFKPEQILIIEDVELKKQKKETLRLIEDFLNISHFSWEDDDLKNSNVGVYIQQMPVECKQLLTQFFEPWNNKFFEMIGRRMDW